MVTLLTPSMVMMPRIFNRKSAAFKRGLKHGYRSGLEETISKQISGAGLKVEYETEKVYYTIPQRSTHYTPDFKLPKKGGFWYLEAKGIWAVADRAKHRLIQQQHPDLDIRFLFQRDQRLYKGSPTKYSQYCDKWGFVYAFRTIPDEWIQECLDAQK